MSNSSSVKQTETMQKLHTQKKLEILYKRKFSDSLKGLQTKRDKDDNGKTSNGSNLGTPTFQA